MTIKKNANSIVAVLISTAVLGVAVGYGLSFWEYWRASQHATSNANSPANSARSDAAEQQRAEAPELDAAGNPSIIGETTI
ncbi:MAG: hypothetical protein MUC43_07160 [Pirellula sp.]|jgi:hypothetical protein|nr:hypothetical protein [Pirellula sp.]